MRTVLKSKIHRCWVTDNNPDYVGSVIIDRDLMKKADLWDFERVMICNANNGARWDTYVLPGPAGSGEVSVQGPGARLCMKGDCLVILAFDLTDEPVDPKMILVDEDNHFIDYVPAEHYAKVH